VLCFTKIAIPRCQYRLRFQASNEALDWSIVWTSLLSFYYVYLRIEFYYRYSTPCQRQLKLTYFTRVVHTIQESPIP